MLTNKFSPEARMKAILARRAQARIDRKTSSQKKASAKAQAKALVDRLKKNLSDSKKLKEQKERDKEAVAKKDAKQKELKEQKVASLDKSKDEKKGPVMNNVVKAMLIINAKKGWSEEARRKAALKQRMERRAKMLAKAAKRPTAKAFDPKHVYTDADIEAERKAQRKRRKAEMKAFSNNAGKKGWSEAARRKAAMTRKAKKAPTALDYAVDFSKEASGRTSSARSPKDHIKAAAAHRAAAKAYSTLHDEAKDYNTRESYKSKALKHTYTAADHDALSKGKAPKYYLPAQRGITGNVKKGWSDAARKKAAMTRKQRRSMNLSGHVAAGNYSYREATNKIEKARKTMENRIKIGAIAPEERRLFNKKVDGFHSNLTRKMDRMVKEGDVSPSEFIGLKKEMKAFISDRAFVESSRKAKERQKKRTNSGKSPFGPG